MAAAGGGKAIRTARSTSIIGGQLLSGGGLCVPADPAGPETAHAVCAGMSAIGAAA